MILFDESSPLFMGGDQMIMQRYTLAMSTGDHLQAPVFDRSILQIVRQKHSHPIRPEPIMQAGGMERVSD